MKKYSLGIDFGTLSARAVIVDVESGECVGEGVSQYAHGVMSERFLNGERLPAGYALQHPQDYIDSLSASVRIALASCKISAADVVGIGIDFTASTVIPTDGRGEPLCLLDELRENPHAYAKLWKHHAAQCDADRINALARERGEAWHGRYGGNVSGEWMLPKAMEILRCDAELYGRVARFFEAGDFIVSRLVGRERHSLCMAGFKAMYDIEAGYPSAEFCSELDSRLANIFGTKISKCITEMSKPAGCLSRTGAELLGLNEGTPVASALIDAHAALAALGVNSPGKLLLILGTSACHILVDKCAIDVPGICGRVNGGVYGGMQVYEAGQAAIGDAFDWFMNNCLPKAYYDAAEAAGVGIHKYLRSLAEPLPPGSDGVMALDWFNGCRTPLVNSNLKGAICGLTLTTRPEQIYRALIEACAYGARRIIELYEERGLKIDEIYAAGGIAKKDGLLMQIYADVTKKKIYVSACGEACAYGSALLGATVGGSYASYAEASEKMKKVNPVPYIPNCERSKEYDALYEKYLSLSNYFANEG